MSFADQIKNPSFNDHFKRRFDKTNNTFGKNGDLTPTWSG